jgi:hypothetical protein
LSKRKVKCGPGVEDARRRCMCIPVVANETIETNGGPSLSGPIEQRDEFYQISDAFRVAVVNWRLWGKKEKEEFVDFTRR